MIQIENENKKNNFMIAILLALPYMLPAAISYTAVGSFILRLRYISFAIMLLLYFNKGRIVINRLIISICMFLAALMFTTIYHHGEIIMVIRQCSDFLFPILWIDYMLKKYEYKTIQWLARYYFVMFLFNSVLMIIFPSGIYNTDAYNKIFLIGIDNKMAFTIIPALGIALMYIEKRYNNSKKKWYILSYIIIYSFSVFYIWAAASMMGIVFLIALMICDSCLDRIKVKNLLNLRNIVIAITIICYLVVFTKIFEKGILADFIVGVLHKNTSFSSRTVLWNQAITKIMKSPFTGYGLSSNTIFDFSFTGRDGTIGGFSPHNGILRLLLEGGIILLLLYLNIFYSLYKGRKQQWENNSCNHVLVFSIAGFLLVCIFEAEYYSFTFLLLLGITNYYMSQKGKQTQVGDEL